MKVVVLGAGLMGKEVARDLSASDKVEKVYLADLDIEMVKILSMKQIYKKWKQCIEMQKTKNNCVISLQKETCVLTHCSMSLMNV